MISVVSIPHSGTQFLENLLIEMGLEVRCAHVHADHPVQNPRRWVEEGGKVVIPWRDPELVKISAMNRGETPRPSEEFGQLVKWGRLRNVHIFNVEPDEGAAREHELKKLQVFLGTAQPAMTDWTPINTSEDVTGKKAQYMRRVVPIASLAPDVM